MSLSRTFSPVLHFEDGNGHPLAGGYLCTYIAGTNTPVATFRDGNGTLNPTQIQLDSRGECEVWLDASIRYKFALYDSTKTTPIWTKDDITAPGVVVMPDTKEVQVVGSSPVLVSAVTNNGITTFTVALDSTFTTAVSKNTQDIAEEVSRATTAEGLLNTAIGNESLRAQGREGELGTAISNEVTRAQAAEAAAKTVVVAGDNINVDESTAPDGHKIYTVNGVESVPNVNITSPHSTINVTSSEDHQTNTKTFSIDVKGKALSLGWFTSRAMTYDSSLGVFKTDLFDKVNNGYENPQGDKITYDANTNKVYIAKGIWHIDAAIEIDWTGTPQNEFIYISGLAFDLSYNHKETFSRGLVRQVNASTALAVTAHVSETPPQGLQVRATFCEIYALEQAQETVVQGLTEVQHDETLSGTGTEDDPLSVEGGGTEYTAGNGIDISDDTISVKNGKGIFIDSNGHVTTDEPRDNFIDITNEWIFVNGYRLKYNGASPGIGNDMRILYSESSGIVKFTGDMRINTDYDVQTANWNVFLRYTGSRFYTNKTARDQSDYPKIGYIPEIGGSVNIPLSNDNGSSLKSIGKIAYIGSPNSLEQDTGLAFNPYNIVSGENIGGCICTNLVIRVTKREN